jgi:hypothetical protein
MKYAYHFYEDRELIAATLESETPLPHLQEGVRLLLNTEQYSAKAGKALVIRQIDLAITHLGGSFVRYDSHIYCHVAS